MKPYYETNSGALTGEDLSRVRGGYRISRNRGLRPGKQVSDSILIEIGKRIISGDEYNEIAREYSISRKTVYRWKKRLGLTRGVNARAAPPEET